MPTGPSDRKVLFLRIPLELYEALRREAFEKEVSLNALVVSKLRKAMGFKR